MDILRILLDLVQNQSQFYLNFFIYFFRFVKRIIFIQIFRINRYFYSIQIFYMRLCHGRYVGSVTLSIVHFRKVHFVQVTFCLGNILFRCHLVQITSRIGNFSYNIIHNRMERNLRTHDEENPPNHIFKTMYL